MMLLWIILFTTTYLIPCTVSDKLIDTIHLEFRDGYKNELREGTLWINGCDFDSGMIL